MVAYSNSVIMLFQFSLAFELSCVLHVLRFLQWSLSCYSQITKAALLGQTGKFEASKEDQTVLLEHLSHFC